HSLRSFCRPRHARPVVRAHSHERLRALRTQAAQAAAPAAAAGLLQTRVRTAAEGISAERGGTPRHERSRVLCRDQDYPDDRSSAEAAGGERARPNCESVRDGATVNLPTLARPGHCPPLREHNIPIFIGAKLCATQPKVQPYDPCESGCATV